LLIVVLPWRLRCADVSPILHAGDAGVKRFGQKIAYFEKMRSWSSAFPARMWLWRKVFLPKAPEVILRTDVETVRVNGGRRGETSVEVALT